MLAHGLGLRLGPGSASISGTDASAPTVRRRGLRLEPGSAIITGAGASQPLRSGDAGRAAYPARLLADQREDPLEGGPKKAGSRSGLLGPCVGLWVGASAQSLEPGVERPERNGMDRRSEDPYKSGLKLSIVLPTLTPGSLPSGGAVTEACDL